MSSILPRIESGYHKSKKEIIALNCNYANLSDLEWLQINKSQAEIHIQAIAELMWDAYNESTPKQLKAGEFHLPFIEIEEDLEIIK